MEPINYNQGCIVADKEYMELVRRQATAHNIALIYDEVLSAFRTGPDCAQGYYGVTPDLCVLGKAVANGEPQHVGWAYERSGGGRGFGFTGGHEHKNWKDDNYRGIMLNAILWTAGLEVPEKGVPSKTPTDEEIKSNLD